MGSVQFVVFVVFLSTVSRFVSSAEDAIIFTSVPDSITFNTVEALHSSEVANVFSTMLSYSLHEPGRWQSQIYVSPFKRPEALMVLQLQGIPRDVQLDIPGTKLPLENQGYVDKQAVPLFLRTNARFNNSTQGRPCLVDFNAGDDLYPEESECPVLFKSFPADAEGRLKKAKEDPDLGRTLKEGTFNISSKPDSALMLELITVKLLNNALKSNKATIRDGVPDIFWIKMTSLHDIVDMYGSDSLQFKEAERLTKQVIMESTATLDNTYDKQAIMSVITERAFPYQLTRTVRSLMQAKETASANGIVFMANYTAYGFSNDFNVAFALTTFTSVLLILTVFGVSVGIWFMDPGRDSIIYRMTSQRKKD